MVLIEEIKNKDGEVLKTKEGEILKNYTLEVGDEFIPLYNKVHETQKPIVEKDSKKEKTIVEYKIVARIKDVKEVLQKGEEIFISLTPSQAQTIKNKLANGVEITQHKFSCYEYKNPLGSWIGVGFGKDFKPAKTFEEIEAEKSSGISTEEKVSETQETKEE